MGLPEKITNIDEVKVIDGQVKYKDLLVKHYKKMSPDEGKPFYITRFSKPAEDNHSHPQALEVISQEHIGEDGEIVSVILEVTTRFNNKFCNHGLRLVRTIK